MAINTLGDLTSHFMLRRQNVALRNDMQRLTKELTSGESADPIGHLAGDMAAFADLTHRMTVNAAYRNSASEAATLTDGLQRALGGFQDVTSDLAAALITMSESGLPQSSRVAAGEARSVLDTAVGILNSRIAGRSLLAGQDVTGTALAGVDVILDDLRIALVGLTTADDVISAVDNWFDVPGGGFETVAYLGAQDPIPAFQVAENEMASLDLRADHDAVRAALKQLAIATLAADPLLAFDQPTTQALYRHSATHLFEVQDGLTAVRADLGVTQARLEESNVRLAAERQTLETARSDLLSIDPYESATRLQQVQSNLESLYAVTVRLSRLSLTEYM
jgi:flagellar hook-associated protein 3 FlgL